MRARHSQKGQYAKYKAKALAEMTADKRDKRHGTHTGYQYGCRCEDCKKAGPWEAGFKRSTASEVREGIRAYRRWLAMGGTHEGWKEWREFAVETSQGGLV